MSSADPASLPVQGLTHYITVGGTDLPLPPSARPDLAFEYTYAFPDATGQYGISHLVRGHYIEIPLAARTVYVADGTVVTRSITFQIVEISQAIRVSALVNGTVTAGQSVILSFAAGAGGAYGPQNARYFTPIPAVVALPGDAINLNTSTNQAAADAWSVTSMSVIRIPTGPVPSTSQTPATATLTLV